MKAKIVDVTRGGGQKVHHHHASASSFMLTNAAAGVDNPMTGPDHSHPPLKRTTKARMSKAHNPEGQMSERVLGDITNKVVNHQDRPNETKSVTQLDRHVKEEICQEVTEKKIYNIPSITGLEASVPEEMHDHEEGANSCECMNELKEKDIRTIYCHSKTNNSKLNETCESSDQQNRNRVNASASAIALENS